ncbi:MAG TPA: HAMP domain-containing sensor histidine kinase, partial [Anaerolineae bacterium]|nr:HAMP domain-containing sensor histidine kinase [Anaerolineae bacterium]
DAADADRIGQPLDLPDWPRVLSGEIVTHQDYSRRLQADITDVLLPVRQPAGQLSGVVRLSYQLTSVYQQFTALRWLVVGVLIVGLLMGAAVGWILALNLQRPIEQLTQAVDQLASDQPSTVLPEPQPEEFALLVRAFNSLAERLHSLEEARHQLLANMVHELGRPLGALQSGVEALRGGAAEDPALRRELLTGIDTEIRRLRRLLDDLSRHYDQALGPLELNSRAIELNDWLMLVLIPWREAAERKGLQWAITASDEPITIEIDPDRLAQAVGNLISNAIKYTPAGGSISIAVEREPTAALIHVTDTGPGISPDDQAHLFEPFYRGHTARRFQQGMGLGLTIARDLVVAHGGRLELASTLGQGSRFTIWLPRLSPTQPLAA